MAEEGVNSTCCLLFAGSKMESEYELSEFPQNKAVIICRLCPQENLLSQDSFMEAVCPCSLFVDTCNVYLICATGFLYA